MEFPEEETNPGLTRMHFNLRSPGAPAESPNPKRTGLHTRGHLPHVKREGATCFATMRLADSMPREVLLRCEAGKAEDARAIEESANRSVLLRELSRHHHRTIER